MDRLDDCSISFIVGITSLERAAMSGLRMSNDSSLNAFSTVYLMFCSAGRLSAGMMVKILSLAMNPLNSKKNKKCPELDKDKVFTDITSELFSSSNEDHWNKLPP